MSDTFDLYGPNTLEDLLGKSQADELIGLISESQVYKNKKNKLPPVSVIAHLYVHDRLKYIREMIFADSLADFQGEIDKYIDHLTVKARCDMYIFKQIYNEFELNLAVLQNKVTFDTETKEIIRGLFKYVIDDYWLSRLTLAYDQAKDLALFVTIIMTARPQLETKKSYISAIEAIASDYSRTHRGPTVKTIPVDKVEDITLWMDYSFDNNKYNAKLKLSNSKGQTTRDDKLFQQGTLKFLIMKVIDPLTLHKTEIVSGESVMMSELAYQASGNKRSFHINKLNEVIKKHLEIPDGKKIKSFGQNGRVIHVNINIKVVTKAKKDQFR